MTDPTTSQTLLGLIEAVLEAPGATDAGERVYQPADWPAQLSDLPQIRLKIVSEARQSLSRSGTPQYTTTAKVRIIGMAQAFASGNDAGGAAAEAAAWALKRQIEIAVINSYPLFQQIQQIATIDSGLAYSAEGETHVAGVQMDMDLEFYEDWESFAPVSSTPVNDLLLTAENYPPASIDIDATGANNPSIS